MKFEFQFAEQDCADYAKVLFKHSRLLSGLGILRSIGFAFVVGIPAYLICQKTGIVPNRPDEHPTTFIFIGITLLLLYFGIKNNIKEKLTKQLIELPPVEIETNEQSFVESTQNGVNRFQWNIYEAWVETQNLFVLLEKTGNSFRAIPKRAFAPGDEEQFRQLLMKIIPNKK
jgi:hypothetical protein